MVNVGAAKILQVLVQESGHRDTVLVAITGYRREGDRQRAQQASFGHHLVKPAKFREVREILGTAAAKAT